MPRLHGRGTMHAKASQVFAALLLCGIYGYRYDSCITKPSRFKAVVQECPGKGEYHTSANTILV